MIAKQNLLMVDIRSNLVEFSVDRSTESHFESTEDSLVANLMHNNTVGHQKISRVSQGRKM